MALVQTLSSIQFSDASKSIAERLEQVPGCQRSAKWLARALRSGHWPCRVVCGPELQSSHSGHAPNENEITEVSRGRVNVCLCVHVLVCNDALSEPTGAWSTF